CRAEGHDHFRLGVKQLTRQGRKALHAAVGGLGFDYEVGPLDIAKGAQAFAQSGLGLSRLSSPVEKSDPVALPYRLRVGDERRGEESEGARDERSPVHHWITSSARDSTKGGIVRPSPYTL